MKPFNLERRKFLKLTSSAAGASLVLGINWSCTEENNAQLSKNVFSPNAWLSINQDETVTVVVAESEMGQGPFTLLPMMIAEELEVNWDNIVVERAPVDPIYGYQMTGGSSSIRKGWSTLREAGAVARDILVLAASKKLSKPFSELKADNGRVIHEASNRSFSYGELIEYITDLDLPLSSSLKEPHEFKVIGRPVARKDTPDKVNGSAKFGIDTKLPNQLYATVLHCPVFGGKFSSIEHFDDVENKNVLDVFPIREGVAIVATDTWSALKALKSINVKWDFGINKNLDSEGITKKIVSASADLSDNDIQIGDIKKLYSKKYIKHSSSYTQPFHAHMAMEPMNCTSYFKDDGSIDVWVPTQSPSKAYDTVRHLTQSKLERGIKKIGNKLLNGYDNSIDIKTTLLGGGFGRRLVQDYVSESVQIAEKYEQPVQLVWSREEDTQHDYYHPMTYHEMNGLLDQNGIPVGWSHVIKGAGISSFGAAHNYNIPNQTIRVVNLDKMIPKGPWRSVAPHYNVFAVEHFFDELARKGGQDPVELRMMLLDKSNRARKLLEIAADNVNWGGKQQGVVSYGSAITSSFGSHVAQIVELEKISDSDFKVNKVVCAIDCGIVINPDIVKQQMEGSIIFGLSAATKSKITLENGRVEQSNFNDYPILRMDEVPDIEIIISNSQEVPGGIGEPGVPPVAPALANALMVQTGKPAHELPMKLKNQL